MNPPWSPLLLIGTLTILVLNFVFRYVPVGVQSGIAVLQQIDPSTEETAQNLGADGLTTFRKVPYPLLPQHSSRDSFSPSFGP